MPIVHGFDPPERFVAGTVGEPGSRTFFLQARTGARIVSVALEKQPGTARAFVKRTEQVLEAGRPSCPFCGVPVDPEGHLCVRANGFKRRDPA